MCVYLDTNINYKFQKSGPWTQNTRHKHKAPTINKTVYNTLKKCNIEHYITIKSFIKFATFFRSLFCRFLTQ